MNKLITLTILVLLTAFVNGQTTEVEANQFKINFLAPSLEYEKGIREKVTLNFELGTGFAIRSASEVGTDFGFFSIYRGAI